MVKISQIFLSFLKVGLIGFGGGSALIPIIEKEIVDRRNWLKLDTYIQHTVISNITPGALPVKLGALAGYQLRGPAGALTAAYAVTLPGALLTMLILSLFAQAEDQAIALIERFSVGIAVFIIYLLLHFILKTIRIKGKPEQSRRSLIICLAAFIVTGGSEVRHLAADLLALPAIGGGSVLFGIATIDLIILSLFLILFHSYARGRAALLVTGIVSVIFLLARGQSGLLPESIGPYLFAGMAILLAGVLLPRLRGSQNRFRPAHAGGMLRTIFAFLLLPILFIGVIAVIPGLIPDIGSKLAFSGQVALSTLSSFGGGEAYVTVADGIFVGGGYISPETFFRQVVSVANALPGPILVKIASGIGLLFAAENGVTAGWLIGFLAISIAVGLCGLVALLVLMAFDQVRQSRAVLNLRAYILPVICGLLLTTILALGNEIIKLSTQLNIAAWQSLAASSLLITILFTVKRRFDRLPDVLLLLACSLLGYGLLAFA